MRVLEYVFNVLTILGYSRPPSWTSPFKKFLYNVYTTSVFAVIQALLVSEVLDLVLVVDNQDDFADNVYMMTVILITSFKMSGLMRMRANIDMLIDTLNEKPFCPVNAEELNIRTKFDNMAAQKTKAYLSMVEGWVVWAHTMSLIVDSPTGKLLYRAWLPFDHTTPLGYSVASIHQIACSIIATATNAAYDSLFSGLLIHVYSQFEILGHRLRNIHGDENDSLKLCARHHDLIYKFAGIVNKEFKSVMFMQVLMSTFTLCFDLYQLTMHEFSSGSADMVLYVSCTLMQIYYYCWHGNEVKLKSLQVTDMIFESDWTRFSNSAKKILLVMMNRATVPIEFTSLYLVTINLESFKALVKTSYSVFNLLQQTK
ncbi:odorant receptor Or1-like isoform X2 [Nomia melanderi]|uniref:odorant receptor Or1-like isoform X2 n=1 Tax=Nomia melanderi TaxID=2448451 RepID=UPI00130422CC|nr:odorant receptor Or1-like [Nomia melanderi]